MAQKKKSAQSKPRAAEPRMYGDGKPSQGSAQAPAPATQAEPASRTAGATPRTTTRAGATGSYARVDRIADYSYVKTDLRRLGITAAAILAGLIVRGIVIP
jgi:hypothetical protein